MEKSFCNAEQKFLLQIRLQIFVNFQPESFIFEQMRVLSHNRLVRQCDVKS